MTPLYGADLCEAALFPHPLQDRKKRCALRAVMKVWPELEHNWRNRDEAESDIYEAAHDELHDQLKQEYKSAVLAFVLLTVAGAALSWLIQRILDRLYPPHSREMDQGFAAQMDTWSSN